MKTRTLRIKLYAFLLGMWEFRSDFTTHFGPMLIETYDTGRDLAHRLTFRWWDQCSESRFVWPWRKLP